jgi:hypothetical protein
VCPFFPSLVVLGFECRSLCMINKCSTTWVIPIALYALVNFWIRSHFDAWAGLDFNPPIYTPTYLGWQFSNFFPEKSSNCDPPILSLLNSGDYRHEPLSLALSPHYFLMYHYPFKVTFLIKIKDTKGRTCTCYVHPLYPTDNVHLGLEEVYFCW